MQKIMLLAACLFSQADYSQIATLSPSAPTCPGASADIEVFTYTGQQYLQMCVQYFQYTSGVMYISLYNPEEDGIFKNGFE